MSESAYASPVDVLLDEESTARTMVDRHRRYIEEAYGLPEQRSRVLALAQFGATPAMICDVLDAGERAVRKHWSLLHEKGANPEHYGDVFGFDAPAFGAIGSAERIWPWPWTHAVSLDYDDPETNTANRIAVYRDPHLSSPGAADYLVVRDETRRRSGRETTARERNVYPGGEAMARHLSSTAETPMEYRATGLVTELAKGDANGQIRPEDVLGIGYDALPAVSGTLRGRAADAAGILRDDVADRLTAKPGRVDWDYVDGDETLDLFAEPEIQRTDEGLRLR